ncbi:MAG: response regulator transcription factor [Anaerolineales bacterium]
MRGRLVVVAEQDVLEGDMPELLRQAGYEVNGVPSSPQAYMTVYKSMPEMVLYHWPSDSPAAKELFIHLRNVVDVPILILADGSLGKDFAVRTLRLGADDYLHKPYGKKELLARIKAHLRRYWQWNETSTSANVVIDPSSCSLSMENQEIRLTGNEYRLLRCLICHEGRVVSREELRNAIWGADAEKVSSASLNLCIHNLRKKIERDPHRPEYIVTKWGVGYYLARRIQEA